MRFLIHAASLFIALSCVACPIDPPTNDGREGDDRTTDEDEPTGEDKPVDDNDEPVDDDDEPVDDDDEPVVPEPRSDHGKVCFANDDCGGNTICVVEQATDQQGTCRVVCASFTECLGNPEVTRPFDTSCCDVQNGTGACFDQNALPDSVECH